MAHQHKGVPPRLAGVHQQRFEAVRPGRRHWYSHLFTNARRSIEAAKALAFDTCPMEDDCRVVVVDDAQVP